MCLVHWWKAVSIETYVRSREIAIAERLLPEIMVQQREDFKAGIGINMTRILYRCQRNLCEKVKVTDVEGHWTLDQVK